MEGPEPVVGQVGNPFRIASRVAGIGRVRIEVFLEGLVHQGLRRGVGPLHLVVDDPGDGQFAVRVEFEMVALLQKGFRQQAGMEDQVRIDPREVEEIAFFLARHRVDRLVRVGEGIEEGLERSPEEFVEHILEGVAFGTGQDGMFQDVRHAG